MRVITRGAPARIHVRPCCHGHKHPDEQENHHKALSHPWGYHGAQHYVLENPVSRIAAAARCEPHPQPQLQDRSRTRSRNCSRGRTRA